MQVVRGTGQASAIAFEAGDGLALDEVERMSIEAAEESEILLFDLPGEIVSPR